MDYNPGRILSYLDDRKLLDDTLVIYASDHGELLGDYGRYGKRCFLDSAARIPLVVKYSGATGGVTCDEPVSFVVGQYEQKGYAKYMLADHPLDGDGWKQYPLKTMPEDPDAYLLFQDPKGSLPHSPGYATEANRRTNFRFTWYDDLYKSL